MQMFKMEGVPKTIDDKLKQAQIKIPSDNIKCSVCDQLAYGAL